MTYSNDANDDPPEHQETRIIKQESSSREKHAQRVSSGLVHAKLVTHEIVQAILPQCLPRQDIELLARRALRENCRVDGNVAFEHTGVGLALFVRGVAKMDWTRVRKGRQPNGKHTSSGGVACAILVLAARIVQIGRVDINGTGKALCRGIVREGCMAVRSTSRKTRHAPALAPVAEIFSYARPMK